MKKILVSLLLVATLLLGVLAMSGCDFDGNGNGGNGGNGDSQADGVYR